MTHNFPGRVFLIEHKSNMIGDCYVLKFLGVTWAETFDAYSERSLRFQTSAAQFGRGPSDTCCWLVHLIDLLYNNYRKVA